MKKTSQLISFIIIIFIGINSGFTQDITPTPDTATGESVQELATPILPGQRDFHPVVTLTPDVDEMPPASPVSDPFFERTRHTIFARLDYAAKNLDIQQTIQYRNTDSVGLDHLVLDVQANNWANGFRLDGVRIGSYEPEIELETNRLTVPLDQTLQPGQVLVMELYFHLVVPRIEGGIYAFRGFFGYTDRQLNLGHWLPTVAPRINGEWRIHQPIFVGEQLVLSQADWDITLSVENAPEGLVVAAPGVVNQTNGNQWHIIHNAARETAISMSNEFNIDSRETASGVTVEVYTFDDAVVEINQTIHDGAAHVRLIASRSVDMFSDLFGKLPFSRLIVVEGDFPDGMEFSGLVFVGKSYFTNFNGTPSGYLTLITIHEIAHQWWYMRVGNDAAIHPWLDEAFCTYAEFIVFEEYYPVLKDWWWTYRIDSLNPEGAVDSTVYEFVDARGYINAVYLRGAKLLHGIRHDIGTEAFFELLANYIAHSDGLIAQPESFWALFTPDQLTLTRRTRSLYLRNPEIAGN